MAILSGWWVVSEFEQEGTEETENLAFSLSFLCSLQFEFFSN
jgi:hypothetical protein